MKNTDIAEEVKGDVKLGFKSVFTTLNSRCFLPYYLSV